MGIEALALEATDILSVSRAAQQIVTPLAKANSKLVRTSVPVNPDEVKYALDKTSVAIASVDRKMQECVEIIDALNSPEDSGMVFTHDFSAELKERAEILTYQIENLKNVFSMVEDSPSWRPYLATVKDRKSKSIRAISNLRNAYLNIALLAEQFISPVPIVESSVEGSVDEFASAIAASNELLKFKQSEWR